MYTVILKKGEEKRLMAGHPWIYANEVSKIDGKDQQGSVARVESFERKFIGYGFINHHSKIIVRLISKDETPIDRDYFVKKIKKANQYRLSLGYSNNYRVVFGESDGLPGLIVDKYASYLVVQFLSLGMDIRKDMLIDILVQEFQPLGIYERDDVSVREKEGLPLFKGLIYGSLESPVMIEENDLKLLVDIENGQKTGYFLDQKENRDNLKHYVKDKDVLDCFCNVGGFSLCAAKYLAKHVTAVDVSEQALEFVNKHAALNGFANISTIKADVFEQLRSFKQEGKKFDVIILDPPAFTKSVDTVKEGYRGYLDLNQAALKLLNSGGYLITCSCSQHLTLDLFLKMINESVQNVKASAKMLELRMQGKDHATLIGADESFYLKVAVLQLQ
ncbi:MAG: class I SAM-dependent rRNA methyltransferase [Bacilli bacterium]